MYGHTLNSCLQYWTLYVIVKAIINSILNAIVNTIN